MLLSRACLTNLCLCTLSSPAHRVVVYYETQNIGNEYISPTPLISSATHLIIAAFHLNTGSQDNTTNIVTLNDVSPDDSSLTQMWTDVASMKGSGVKVMGLLGGASDGSYQLLHSDFDLYYPPLKSYISKYSLDGIDLDVEESSETLQDIVQLIQQLRSDFGKDFIITLAPVAGAFSGVLNLSGFNYTSLEAQCGDDIDWYNAQFYLGGSMENTTDYVNIVTNFPLDPSRLVAGTLSGNSNLDAIESTVRQLVQMYGDCFGGVAAWEYYNSLPNTSEPWTWAAVMKSAMVN